MPNDFCCRHNIRIFGMHVAQIDGMARLRTIETGVFGDCNAIVETKRIDDGSRA